MDDFDNAAALMETERGPLGTMKDREEETNKWSPERENKEESRVSCHISSSAPKQSKALGHKNFSLQAA